MTNDPCRGVGQVWRDLRVLLTAILLVALPVWGAESDDDDEPEPLVEIPERDEAQIREARSLTWTASQLPAGLARMVTAIDRAMEPKHRAEAQRLIERYPGNAAALANAAAILWVQSSPEHALRVAAEAARSGPDDVNAVNTLAALLAHAGYEGQAIPLLRYLDSVQPDNPTILSNLGVAWLNLGEVEESRRVILRCLALAPGHGVANLVAGVIAESAGRRPEAVAHFRKAAASNSSPQARRILRQQGQSYRSPPGFFGMLPKPEYFSPGAFEPVAPQKTLAEYDQKLADKKALDQALQKLIDENSREMEREMARMLAEAVSGRLDRAHNPYAKLDWDNHIKALDHEGRMELSFKRLSARMQAIGQLRVELDRTPTPGVPEDPIPSCVRRRPMTQAALTKMAAEYEKLVGETLYVWREMTNERIAYLRFVSPPMAYRTGFLATVNAYLGFVQKLNTELPLLPDPCAGQDLTRISALNLALPASPDCPFSLDVSVVVATLHMDCKSFGFDFKAGLAFSVTKDFVSGETTLTAGVGVKTDLGSVGKAGMTGQFVLAWDAGNELCFVGVEAIAAAKLSGIPGLSGTLAGDTFDLGRTPGAESTGPSVTLEGRSLTEDLVKVGADTKLGVTIGPRGVDPTLSGDISGKVLGEKLFEMKSG